MSMIHCPKHIYKASSSDDSFYFVDFTGDGLESSRSVRKSRWRMNLRLTRNGIKGQFSHIR